NGVTDESGDNGIDHRTRAQRHISRPGSGFGDHLRLHLGLGRLALAAYRCALVARGFQRKRIRMVRSLLRIVRSVNAACCVVTSGDGDLVVFGQGFTAYLRQLGRRRDSASDPKLLRVAHELRAVLATSRIIIVVFEIDAATAAARIERRPDQLGPWDRMDPVQRERRLAAELPYMERAVSCLLEARVARRVVRIDATSAPDVIAERMVDVLTGEVSARPPVAG
ncbi:MAG: hypothetical protein ACREKM_02860, partial [Longimicrobiales bacterium]